MGDKLCPERDGNQSRSCHDIDHARLQSTGPPCVFRVVRRFRFLHNVLFLLTLIEFDQGLLDEEGAQPGARPSFPYCYCFIDCQQGKSIPPFRCFHPSIRPSLSTSQNADASSSLSFLPIFFPSLPLSRYIFIHRQYWVVGGG